MIYLVITEWADIDAFESREQADSLAGILGDARVESVLLHDEATGRAVVQREAKIRMDEEHADRYLAEH